ncbi:MAG: dioxygenase [Magnetococcales bacterium]|nr:dioxygenase [Magnetococcales bacterium]
MISIASSSEEVRPIFLSHGAPDILARDTLAGEFLGELGGLLPTPRGIVVVSAHWQHQQAMVTGPGSLETLHDFGGFDPELYQRRYPASGAPWLLETVAEHLEVHGDPVSMDKRRGLDHGAWIPLMRMFPAADIPVLQLALKPGPDFHHHLTQGEGLAALSAMGVLVMGSGSITHNLHQLKSPGENPDSWAVRFQAQLHRGLMAGNGERLATTIREDPAYRQAHPTPEHLAPLFVAMGAGGRGALAEQLHVSYDYGNLCMGIYRF